jgi:hypothetical protein
MRSDKDQGRHGDASLLAAIVDQFVRRASHPVGDIRQFEQLALGLIDILDAPAAARAVAPLSAHIETPATIYARLWEKGGPCAEIALAHWPDAPRAARLAAVTEGDPGLARAVARRADLDRELIDLLLLRTEPAPLRALAANPYVHLDVSARRVLALAARDDATLARILLDRDDPAIDAEPLFLAATRAERSALILAACRRALATGHAETAPVDRDFVSWFEGAAVRRDREAMAAMLAEALDCRKERVRAILSDEQGEALALALSALGYDAETAARIFLCAEAPIAHDADRVRALMTLVRSTPQRAAQQIVSAITGAARGERDSTRRAGFRDDAFAGPGWRRVAPRDVEGRKLDQTG